MAKRKWTDEELIEAVRVAEYWSDVYKTLGIGRLSRSISNAIQRLNLDTAHIAKRKPSVGRGYWTKIIQNETKKHPR